MKKIGNGLNSMNKLDELIKNKRTIIVGPSPYLLEYDRGKYYDSFDTVIRTNGSLFMEPNMYKNYGSKTDILYINGEFSRKLLEIDINKIKRAIEEKNIKLIVIKGGQVFKQISEKLKPIINITPLNSLTLINTASLMGNLILYHILHYQPKNIFITGFDFYYSKNCYFSGYINVLNNSQPLPKVRENINMLSNEELNNIVPDNIKDIQSRSTQLHDQYLNTILFLYLYKRNKNIILCIK